jgi:hypothetical protein
MPGIPNDLGLICPDKYSKKYRGILFNLLGGAIRLQGIVLKYDIRMKHDIRTGCLRRFSLANFLQRSSFASCPFPKLFSPPITQAS